MNYYYISKLNENSEKLSDKRLVYHYYSEIEIILSRSIKL